MSNFFGKLVTPFAIAAVVCGCSGTGGGSSFSLSRAVGSFGGGYQSSASRSSTTESGFLRLNIDASGNATGTITNETNDTNGTANGTVGANGAFTLNVDYGNGDTSTITGMLDLNAQNSLESNFTETDTNGGDQGTFNGSFRLVKNVDQDGSGSNNDFTGNFAGDVRGALNVDNGDIQLAIGSSGQVSGILEDTLNNRTGYVTGTINNSGSFNLTVDYGTDSSNITGDFDFSGSSTITSSFVETGITNALSGSFQLTRQGS